MVSAAVVQRASVDCVHVRQRLDWTNSFFAASDGSEVEVKVHVGVFVSAMAEQKDGEHVPR